MESVTESCIFKVVMNLANLISFFRACHIGFPGPARTLVVSAVALPMSVANQSDLDNRRKRRPLAKPEQTQTPPPQVEPEKQPAMPAPAQQEPKAAETGTSSPPADAKPATQKCRKSKSGKCLTKTTSTGQPKKVVVRNGSTSEPEVKLAPTVPTDIASQQVQVTEQLLATAENNLKQAGARQLNTDQAAVVEQIETTSTRREPPRSLATSSAATIWPSKRGLSDDLVAH